ncbi:hypothetical protein MPSI1_003536 [Malassezia psittaci]|uniref:Transmembrane 9 superfamily member n=1 Tax=Malassezia psittaci TaxID=1821823 RepID=A0AAF0JFM0_9BASI|nr:hypothetical protein MPSI1_003536 [Malassezia psittaci]
MMHGAWDVGGLWLVKWIVLLAAVVPCSAWYLPGSAPRSFGKGDSVPVQVNTLQPMSGATPVHGLVSYDYYDDRLAFCKPESGILPQSGSLGSILLGDRIYNSPLEIHMLQDEQCSLLCKQTVNEKQAAFINERINERYGINWMVDGLPVADAGLTGTDGTVRANSVGFALGSTYDANLNRLATPALYNHYRLNVSYHERSPNEYRVVGVNVIPMSMESLPNGLQGSVSCENAQPMFLSNSSQTPVAYTYDVVWTPSNTPWATRWDAYLHVVDPRIHWYSLLNSIAIVALLCVMVGLIMARAVRRDIYRYNAIDLTEDIQEDYGWKLVHGEVFRPPSSPMLLSVMAGTGAQLLAIAVVTLFFALLGFLSPSNRGSLATIMIITWTLFGIVSGWVSAKVYASFDGEKWRRNMLLTATLFPALVFGTMNLLNVLLVYDHSAGAVPFGTLLTLVVLWSLINAPLSFLGSYLGLKSGAISHPVRVNQIPRQIPPSPWYLRLWPSAILTGIMPFGAAWLELFFIITSLFGNRVYYAFGFLTLTFVVTTAVRRFFTDSRQLLPSVFLHAISTYVLKSTAGNGAHSSRVDQVHSGCSLMEYVCYVLT